MHARLSVAGFVIVVGLCISIPTAAGAVGAAQTGSAQKHLSADQCKQGGWQSLTDGQGQPFRNQGQCISYAIHHPVSLSDLTLKGTAAGPITSVIVPPFSLFPASATLTLIATSGTGDFTEMTGTLNVSLQWPVPGSLSFIGTIAPT
jgi:hypothetical protein